MRSDDAINRKARLRRGITGELRIDEFTGEIEWWSKEDVLAAAGPRCPRCQMLEPHRCLPESATELAQQRRDNVEGVVRIPKR